MGDGGYMCYAKETREMTKESRTAFLPLNNNPLLLPHNQRTHLPAPFMIAHKHSRQWLKRRRTRRRRRQNNRQRNIDFIKGRDRRRGRRGSPTSTKPIVIIFIYNTFTGSLRLARFAEDDATTGLQSRGFRSVFCFAGAGSGFVGAGAAALELAEEFADFEEV